MRRVDAQARLRRRQRDEARDGRRGQLERRESVDRVQLGLDRVHQAVKVIVRDREREAVEKGAIVAGAEVGLLAGPHPSRQLLRHLELRQLAGREREVLAHVTQRLERIGRGEDARGGLQPEVLHRPSLELRRRLGLLREQCALERLQLLRQLGTTRRERAEEEAPHVRLVLRLALGRLVIVAFDATQVLHGLVVQHLVLHILDRELHAVSLKRLRASARRGAHLRPVDVDDGALARALRERRVSGAKRGRAEWRVEHDHGRRAAADASEHVVHGERRHLGRLALLERLGHGAATGEHRVDQSGCGLRGAQRLHAAARAHPSVRGVHAVFLLFTRLQLAEHFDTRGEDVRCQVAAQQLKTERRE